MGISDSNAGLPATAIAPMGARSGAPGARWLSGVGLSLVLVVGAVVRVLLARTGHNFDVDSWQIVADLARNGADVYASTTRYNYGPLWMQVLRGLDSLQAHTARFLHVSGPESFHTYIAAFLSLVDVCIAIVLARRIGVLSAIVFFLCPVSVLITGFHSQIDNLAVLFGLLAWCLLRPSGGKSPSWLRTISAGVLFGLSLATKHLLFLLPVWLLIGGRRLLSPGRAWVVALLAYGCFAASFVPFSRTPASRTGIVEHVLRYRSVVDDGALLVRAVDIIVPYGMFARPASWTHGILPDGLFALYIALMLIAGRVTALSRPAEIFPIYLISLTVFSIAWADQYLAIPLLACAVYRRHWASWIYMLTATCYLLQSPRNLGTFGGSDLLFNITGVGGIKYYQVVFWLLPLLAKDWLPGAWRMHLLPAAKRLAVFLWRGKPASIDAPPGDSAPTPD